MTYCDETLPMILIPVDQWPLVVVLTTMDMKLLGLVRCLPFPADLM